jgi:ketosteroid isomerase-like protein
MRTSGIPATAALLLAIGACQPAPITLTDTDRAALQTATDHAVELANAGAEWITYVEHYYAPDATFLPPNGPPVQGTQDIAAFHAMLPPMSEVEFRQVEVGGAGDVAYVHGTYSMTLSPEGGEPFQDSGKYIEIWKRQGDGTWKVALDIFNSDLPLPSPEGAM